MKKKSTRLELAFDAYMDRLQDLLDNPEYEDLSNRKLNPLIKANEKIMLDALLEDEDETANLLRQPLVLEKLLNFIFSIQEKFKSRKIAKQMDEALIDIRNNKYSTVSKDYFKYIKRKIKAANKILEDN
ncbi:MAG: hypothetical protein WCR97_06245 [Bacilli bacterium]